MANNQQLLLFGLGREISPKEYKMMATTFEGESTKNDRALRGALLTRSTSEQPTAKAVQERLTKLRKEQITTLTQTGFFAQASRLGEYQKAPEDTRTEEQAAERTSAEAAGGLLAAIKRSDSDDQESAAAHLEPAVQPPSASSRTASQISQAINTQFSTPASRVLDGLDRYIADTEASQCHSKKRKSRDFTADEPTTSSLDVLAQAAASKENTGPEMEKLVKDVSKPAKRKGGVERSPIGFPNIN